MHGSGCLYSPLDLPHAAEGDRVRVCGPLRKKALDRVGSAGGRVVGCGEYADGLRDPGCGPRRGVSNVECECADRTVLGSCAVSRTRGCEREERCQGCAWRDCDCGCGGDARV